MISNEKPAEQPAWTFLPAWGMAGGVANPLLRCESGWDDNSSKAFQQHEFASLWLTFRSDQSMHIPALGPKALCIKQLYMVGSGTVSGLAQFKNVERLSISIFPKNGIDFDMFPKLQHLTSIWDKKYIESIFSCSRLNGLDIDEGYADEDCHRYGALPGLTNMGVTGGRIRSLQGLENCRHLASLGIAYARNFTDLGDLTRFGKLAALSLANLPKLQSTVEWGALKSLRDVNFLNLPGPIGTIDFTGLKLMEEIYVVKCPDAVLDLSGISEMHNLRKLWSTAPHIKLNVDAMFSLRKLELCGLNASDGLAASDEDLLGLAAIHHRKVSKIDRIGRKKNQHIHIFFDNA